MSSNSLPLDAIAVVSQQQVSTTLSGEVIILGLQDTVYYGLQEVGTRIWQLLQTPRSIRDIAACIVAEYDVVERDAVADVQAFISDLVSRKLVVINPPA